VEHPQVCFMAVGHAMDRAPLQVGQFESTASLIDAWLTRIWMEGGGAGQHEAYELAMYYAARHVTLDSVQLRGQRGFLFLTADVAPNPAVSRVEVKRILGDDLPADVPIRALIEELQRSFEPFVLLADAASPKVERAWRDLFGDRVLRMRHTDDAAHIASGLVALLQGSVGSLGAYVGRLEAQGLGRKAAARVATALVPFAASIGRDGAPRPIVKPLDLPKGDPPSGLERL
ncbi:MAG: VWA domain-containing protein, partial [Myxococcales bacterium]|nr:VWA domain-containing protein [Myxococcales bacterium]